MASKGKKVTLVIKEADGASRYAFETACKSLNSTKGEIISEMMIQKAIEVLGERRVDYLLEEYASDLETKELLKNKNNNQPPEPSQ